MFVRSKGVGRGLVGRISCRGIGGHMKRRKGGRWRGRRRGWRCEVRVGCKEADCVFAQVRIEGAFDAALARHMRGPCYEVRTFLSNGKAQAHVATTSHRLMCFLNGAPLHMRLRSASTTDRMLFKACFPFLMSAKITACPLRGAATPPDCTFSSPPPPPESK